MHNREFIFKCPVENLETSSESELAGSVVDWYEGVIGTIEDSATHATNTKLCAIGYIESGLVNTLLPDLVELLIIGVVPNIIDTLRKHVKISR